MDHKEPARTTFKDNAIFQLDASVGGATISPSGRDVALASTDALQILDLDSPHLSPRVLPHHPKGNIADVQWSPHASREAWIVVAAGELATLWDVEASTPERPVTKDLRGHSRSIADLNFSVFKPDVLATCGLDSFVHLWDLREDCSRPVIRFADWFLGGYQVKWNRQDENIIASSHSNRLHIWDIRKGANPLRTIEAHFSHITGIDWNRDYRDNILTCSLDKTIKFWNWARAPDPKGDSVGDPKDRVIRTPYPVRRARHTPFGYGIIAMAAEIDQRLYLYDRRTKKLSDRDAAIDPVHAFDGHLGPVQEFLWRYRGGVDDDQLDLREFQLVSWGKDKKLCLHKLPTKTMAKVGFEKGGPYEGSMVFTRKGAEYKTFRFESQAPVSDTITARLWSESCNSRTSPSDTPGWSVRSRPYLSDNKNVEPRDPSAELARIKNDEMNLELDHIIKALPVALEKANFRKRSARLCVDGPWGVRKASVEVQISFKFPDEYPQSSPSFKLNLSPLAYPGALSILQRSISSIIKGHSKLQNRCLQPVLEFLLGTRSFDESIPAAAGPMRGYNLDGACDEDSEDASPANQPEPLETEAAVYDEEEEDFGLDDSTVDVAGLQKAQVPLPRTSGATFAANGDLVCFFLAGTTPAEPRKTPDELGFRGKIAEMMDQNAGYIGMGTSQSASLSDDESGSDTGVSSSLEQATKSLASLQITDTWRGRYDVSSSEGFGIQAHNEQAVDSNRQYKSWYGQNKNFKGTSVVSINPSEGLLPLNVWLARNYQMNGPPSEACAHNSKVSKLHADAGSKAHYVRVTEMWRDAAVVASGPLPIGQKVVSQMLAELEANGDTQSLATMSTVLAEDQLPREDPCTLKRAVQSLGKDCSHQVQAALMEEVAMMNPTNVEMTLLNQHAFDPTTKHTPLLHMDECQRHRQCRDSYGEQLYSWQLYTAGSEMLKKNSSATGSSSDYRVRLEDAKDAMPQCPLCWQRICGTAAMCPACKHALHLECHLSLSEEAGTDMECPEAGCGCQCFTNGRRPDTA